MKFQISVQLCLLLLVSCGSQLTVAAAGSGPNTLGGPNSGGRNGSKASPVVEDIADIKDLKKLLRTKNNVLVAYVASLKEAAAGVRAFREAAHLIKGLGTMALLDCSAPDVRKLCKKQKVAPTPLLLKHYKDGDFHKDYDRQVQASSIVNFMREPTGDLPWEEDPAGADVQHIQDAATLGKFLRREQRPTMVMFYAPWCGFCKQMKPDYSAAATELRPKYVLAAIDVNRPENSVIRKLYNITGFPTLLYYEFGEMRFTYDGDNKKDAIVKFMQNPAAPPAVKSKDTDWAAEAASEIVHLNAANFEPVLRDEKSVLVMFYAPWCGHCKRMKPEYEKAAEIMSEKSIPGVLAALDATKDGAVAARFGVKGYPSVKYFVNGEFKFDVNVRDADKILEFMRNPSEPPPPPPAEKPWEEEEVSEVVHLNDETFKGFLKKKKHVLVMFYAPWCGHCKKAKPEFVTAAAHYADDPRTELAAVDCTQHSALCSVYSVKGYPTLKYFSYLKTVRDYSGGRLAPDFIKFLADPDAPEEPKAAVPFGSYPGSENVVLLTDADFEERLRRESRALVMFYAPWCGHCTNMKAAYSKAAERAAATKVGIIAALDATSNPNASKKYGVNGFPTLKYFENGVLRHDYNGKRTAEDLYAFVAGSGSAAAKDEL